MKRSAPMKPGKPLARSAFKPKPSTEKKAAPAQKARMKTKQRAVTSAEREYWNRLAGLGCIACMIDHVHQPEVSIHHVDGRTKPGCHMLVLPLCAGHHQAGTGNNKELVAVHPDKARFEARYGTQAELMDRCNHLLGVIGDGN